MSESELTIDEYTVLMLADDGQYMAPIGRWKAPIIALAQRGLLRKLDEVNYVVTLEGTKARAERDKADDDAMRELLEGGSKTIEGRAEEETVEPLIADELKDG